MTEKHTRSTVGAKPTTKTPPPVKTIHRSIAAVLFAATVIVLPLAAQTSQNTFPGGSFPSAPQLQLPRLPTPPPITPNGSVIEDVIARVNDQIITRSEYERSEQQLLQDAQQQQGVTPAEFQSHLKDLLRDMIDSQLLLAKGKELGITCDAETVRQLDEIRKQNHLPDMEALEKAASSQGISYEDFKQNIRNQCIRQSVVRDEVGRRLNLTHSQEEAYYAAHAKEFEVPEQLHLSEILIPTPDGASDAQLAAAKAKADDVAAKLKAGEKFADAAKAYSGGPSASAGGDLGDFKRGSLGQVLEDATFPLPVGGDTAPIRTRQGYVILHIDAHQAAGVPPLASVENEVQNAIYVDQLQPALRAYLTKARQSAFVEVAPGFIDTGSVGKSNNANFAYTAYNAPAVKKKYQAKQKAEQERAARAQAELAAARERVADKQAAKAAADQAKLEANQKGKPGVKTVSGVRIPKPKKTRREKIRYGQAPRNSLPVAATTVSADTTAPGAAPIGGVAPGVAMAPTESITSITTGVGAEAGPDDPNALAQSDAPTKKTRFAAQQTQAEVDRAKSKLGKAETKATIRPVAATRTETTAEKVQAAPLGLNGDTVKKKPRPKKKKGDEKERLQATPKPVAPPTPIAPTVNPAVTGAPAATAPATTSAPPQ
jgi:peptidyl-prolyl cis-trans isomerase SurA